MDLLLNRPQILGPIVAGESKSLPALDGTDDVVRHYLQLLRMCKNSITKLAPNEEKKINNSLHTTFKCN